MKDYLGYIDDYISGTLPADLIAEVKLRLIRDEELRKEYQILLASRQYIIAKSTLEEIKSDPELHLAEELVEEYLSDHDTSSWTITGCYE